MENMKKYRIWSMACMATIGLTTHVACAQSASVPSVAEGNSWTYSVTEEKAAPDGGMASTTHKWENTITRAGEKTFSISVKQLESTNLPRELLRNSDWSVGRNINGASVTTSRPYEFPLTPGKEWKIEFSTDAPEPGTKVEKVVKRYTVVGWTDIKVPAGTFHALKVEMEGEWSKEFTEVGPSASASVATNNGGSISVAKKTEAKTPTPVTGKLYAAFWYAPEVKSHVKLVVEDYKPTGLLNKRTTEVLESMNVN